MSLETWQARYPTYIQGSLGNFKLREALRMETGRQSFLWSARLSTGLFGLPRCPSVNKESIPKGENEILFAFGDNGLAKLIDLGFIPCVACHPERVSLFWEKAKEAVKRNYPYLTHTYQFANKTTLPFDARRVKWEELAPHLSALPNRLYLPKNLTADELISFRQRVKLLGFEIPKIGFMQKVGGKNRFFEYKIQ